MEIRESILYSLLYRNSFLIVPIRLWRNCKKSKMPIIWICNFEFEEAQHHAKRRDAGLLT